MGRELGEEGLDAFRETKHVHIETKLEVKEWWYPYAGGDAPPQARDHVRRAGDVVGTCTELSTPARSATSSSTPTTTAA